jgi:AcrR family transcriptional regulator
VGAKTPKTSDRRIQKTHRALQEALITLIVERGWDNFTVQDLCERADVGRSTFYMHFADKEDVVTGGLGEFRKGVRAAVASRKGDSEPFAFVRPLIEHAFEQQRAFRALLGKGSGQPVLRRFRELVSEMVQDDLAGVVASKLKKGAATAFLVGGFLDLLTWGLERGPACGPQELEQLFQQMAAPVLELLQRP